MFADLRILSVSGLFAAALALPRASCSSNTTAPSNGICKDYTVTAAVTSEDLIYVVEEFQSNFDVANWLFNTSRKDTETAFQPFAGTGNVTKEYTISGTFCSPKQTKDGKETTVLLATHGLGYDGRYWASNYKPEEYSFVDHALSNGYSVFYYDRIGTGKSGKESGYTNQALNQIAMLSHLLSSIRGGQYTADIKAQKVALVGHSFGSLLSHVVAVRLPDLVDALVLTGLAYANQSDLGATSGRWGATAFASRIASGVEPERFPPNEYDSGYLAFGDIYSHVETFFHDYDQDVAKYAHSISNAFGAAEFASLGHTDLGVSAIKGGVLVTTGEFDLLACGGECESTFANGIPELFFGNAKPLETYVHAGAGHGINFNKNATGFYEVIVDFLDRNV